MHSGANAAPVAETNLPRIALSWMFRRGDMPFRIEVEWIGVGLWIVKHVPIQGGGSVKNESVKGE